MQLSRPVLRLGLTGGIGSGKTTVARSLEARGATVVDADAIARTCTLTGGSAIPELIQAFGPDFFTSEGALDRQRMREHVFSHPESRLRLEQIVHPHIGLEMERQVRAAAAATCIVFDVPLLVESPRWRGQLDCVLVVDCQPETQIRRVQARNGWTRDTIKGILSSQSPRAMRVAAADLVIFNDVDEFEPLQRLIAQVSDRFGL